VGRRAARQGARIIPAAHDPPAGEETLALLGRATMTTSRSPPCTTMRGCMLDHGGRLYE